MSCAEIRTRIIVNLRLRSGNNLLGIRWRCERVTDERPRIDRRRRRSSRETISPYPVEPVDEAAAAGSVPAGENRIRWRQRDVPCRCDRRRSDRTSGRTDSSFDGLENGSFPLSSPSSIRQIEYCREELSRADPFDRATLRSVRDSVHQGETIDSNSSSEVSSYVGSCVRWGSWPRSIHAESIPIAFAPATSA